MSRYSGSYYKGASKQVHKEKAEQAARRTALAHVHQCPVCPNRHDRNRPCTNPDQLRQWELDLLHGRKADEDMLLDLLYERFAATLPDVLSGICVHCNDIVVRTNVINEWMGRDGTPDCPDNPTYEHEVRS